MRSIPILLFVGIGVFSVFLVQNSSSIESKKFVLEESCLQRIGSSREITILSDSFSKLLACEDFAYVQQGFADRFNEEIPVTDSLNIFFVEIKRDSFAIFSTHELVQLMALYDMRPLTLREFLSLAHRDPYLGNAEKIVALGTDSTHDLWGAPYLSWNSDGRALMIARKNTTWNHEWRFAVTTR